MTRNCLSVKSGDTGGQLTGRGYGTTWGTIKIIRARRRLARTPALRKADRVDSMDVKITAIFNLEFTAPAAGRYGILDPVAGKFSMVGDIFVHAPP
jgi:hypothetical protein